MAVSMLIESGEVPANKKKKKKRETFYRAYYKREREEPRPAVRAPSPGILLGPSKRGKKERRRTHLFQCQEYGSQVVQGHLPSSFLKPLSPCPPLSILLAKKEKGKKDGNSAVKNRQSPSYFLRFPFFFFSRSSQTVNECLSRE